MILENVLIILGWLPKIYNIHNECIKIKNNDVVYIPSIAKMTLPLYVIQLKIEYEVVRSGCEIYSDLHKYSVIIVLNQFILAHSSMFYIKKKFKKC